MLITEKKVRFMLIDSLPKKEAPPEYGLNAKLIHGASLSRHSKSKVAPNAFLRKENAFPDDIKPISSRIDNPRKKSMSDNNDGISYIRTKTPQVILDGSRGAPRENSVRTGEADDSFRCEIKTIVIPFGRSEPVVNQKLPSIDHAIQDCNESVRPTSTCAGSERRREPKLSCIPTRCQGYVPDLALPVFVKQYQNDESATASVESGRHFFTDNVTRMYHATKFRHWNREMAEIKSTKLPKLQVVSLPKTSTGPAPTPTHNKLSLPPLTPSSKKKKRKLYFPSRKCFTSPAFDYE